MPRKGTREKRPSAKGAEAGDGEVRKGGKRKVGEAGLRTGEEEKLLALLAMKELRDEGAGEPGEDEIAERMEVILRDNTEGWLEDAQKARRSEAIKGVQRESASAGKDESARKKKKATGKKGGAARGGGSDEEEESEGDEEESDDDEDEEDESEEEEEKEKSGKKGGKKGEEGLRRSMKRWRDPENRSLVQSKSRESMRLEVEKRAGLGGGSNYKDRSSGAPPGESRPPWAARQLIDLATIEALVVRVHQLYENAGLEELLEMLEEVLLEVNTQQAYVEVAADTSWERADAWRLALTGTRYGEGAQKELNKVYKEFEKRAGKVSAPGTGKRSREKVENAARRQQQQQQQQAMAWPMGGFPRIRAQQFIPMVQAPRGGATARMRGTGRGGRGGAA